MALFRSGVQVPVYHRMKQLFKSAAYADNFLAAVGLSHGYKQVRNAAGNLTLTLASHGSALIINAAAAVYTLPAPAAGGMISFVNVADVNIEVVTATADTLIAFNDLAADKIGFVTSGEKIGAAFDLLSVDIDGAGAYQWVLIQKCKHTLTVTT